MHGYGRVPTALGDNRGPAVHGDDGGKMSCRASGAPRATAMKTGADMTLFDPSRANNFLLEIYGDYLHKNYGAHLGDGDINNAIWKICW